MNRYSSWYNLRCCEDVVCRLLEFYVLAISNIISEWTLPCESAHTWQLYSAAPLGNQATTTMTQHPTQSHYPTTELTSPCPILLMSSARLGSNKYQFYKSLVWLDQEPNAPISHTRGHILPIWPQHQFCKALNKQQTNYCGTAAILDLRCLYYNAHNNGHNASWPTHSLYPHCNPMSSDS